MNRFDIEPPKNLEDRLNFLNLVCNIADSVDTIKVMYDDVCGEIVGVVYKRQLYVITYFQYEDDYTKNEWYEWTCPYFPIEVEKLSIKANVFINILSILHFKFSCRLEDSLYKTMEKH